MVNHMGQEDGMKAFLVEPGSVFVAQTPHRVFEGCTVRYQVVVEEVKTSIIRGIDGKAPTARTWVSYTTEEEIIESDGTVLTHDDATHTDRDMTHFMSMVTRVADFRQVR